MSFLRRLVGGDDGDEEGEDDALLEHEGYSSSESQSGTSSHDEAQADPNDGMLL